ncbi:38K [Betabaculovirus altermyunipunctae]|uniref:38K n=1 Tax=Betabaculovirus altermyunipunctae TaxID=3051996 RepID=A0A1S5YED8_9BBAC|nr:38K [Betabaculovirus altermyunipunctae]AQQ80357.1 38K [Betabaculovirus altermyunipunctae]
MEGVPQSWLVLHNKYTPVRRHVLFIASCHDLIHVPRKYLELVEFVVTVGPESTTFARQMCTTKRIKCRDNMREFREHLRHTFRLPYFGHTFNLYQKPAPFEMLNEWLVLDLSEIVHTSVNTFGFQPPHVVVFDMDSTLITEEEEVRIRDPRIYESLHQLKLNNCLLCLWSYGDREHVVDSMKKVDIEPYFDIVLAEGNVQGVYSTRETKDRGYDKLYTTTPFHLNVDDRRLIPKSPRVVLWYLKLKGVNFIKSITLADDLPDNDYSYDHFVNLDRCPVPVDDWHVWHNAIVEFINHYDKVNRGIMM